MHELLKQESLANSWHMGIYANDHLPDLDSRVMPRSQRFRSKMARSMSSSYKGHGHGGVLGCRRGLNMASKRCEWLRKFVGTKLSDLSCVLPWSHTHKCKLSAELSSKTLYLNTSCYIFVSFRIIITII